MIGKKAGRRPCDGGTHRVVERGRNAAAQPHIGDCGALVILRHPLDTREDARCRVAADAIERLHRHEGDTFCHPMRGTTDGAGDMRAVPVAILGAASVVDCGESRLEAPREFAMRAADAGVDHIGVNASEVLRVVVARIERQIALVDAIEPPGCAVLDGVDGEDGVQCRITDRGCTGPRGASIHRRRVVLRTGHVMRRACV